MHIPIFSLVARPTTSNLHPQHRISNFLNRGQWLRTRLFRKGKVQHSYQKSIIQSRAGWETSSLSCPRRRLCTRTMCITILGGKTYRDTRRAGVINVPNLSLAVGFNEMLFFFSKLHAFLSVKIFDKLQNSIFLR